jgi:hypothetical protein
VSDMPNKKKPNILIIWGDDIGWFNVSAYNHGLMGYRTPNIDRIAKDGAIDRDEFLPTAPRVRRVLWQPVSPERGGRT